MISIHLTVLLHYINSRLISGLTFKAIYMQEQSSVKKNIKKNWTKTYRLTKSITMPIYIIKKTMWWSHFFQISIKVVREITLPKILNNFSWKINTEHANLLPASHLKHNQMFQQFVWKNEERNRNLDIMGLFSVTGTVTAWNFGRIFLTFCIFANV